MRAAAMASGFFYVRHHGVPQALVQRQFDLAQRLMDQRSPESIMLRNLQMSLDMKPNESPTQYQSRAAAVQSQINNILGEDARRSADNQAAAKTRLESAKLTADQKSSAAKLGLDAQRLSMEQQNAVPARQLNEMEIAASKQLQSLRDRFMAATGAEQEALGKQLQALAGKESRGDWKLQVTPATKNADGSTSAGSIVRYNERTGAVEQVAGGQGGQAASAGQKYEVGQTVQRADGQKARVIAVDASGQPTKFQPL